MSYRSYRYVIVCLCSAAVFLEYATRSNINNAIVSMISEAAGNTTSDVPSDYCPPPQSGLQQNRSKIVAPSWKRLPDVPTYDWSPTTCGVILGSFYYGYIVLQVPSGRLSEMLGGKWIVAAGLLASGLINLVTPQLAYSVPLLTASRVVLGLFQGVVFPACFCLIVNWMSPHERSFGFGLVNVGGNLGAVFACVVTGYVSQNFGWPYSFQGLGIFTVAWTLLCWLLFVRSHPEADEVNILVAEGSDSSQNGSIKSAAGTSSLDLTSMHSVLITDKPAVPWIKILTNRAVLSAGLSRFCGTFGYLTLQTKFPAYLESILHESASSNGVLNSFLFLATSVTMAFGPYLSEILISRRWLSRTNTRKLFSGTAQYGLTACFLLVPLMGCSASHSVCLLVVGMLLYGFVMGGDVIVPVEISPHFATTIYASINMFANFSGVVAPLVIGLVLEGASDGTDLKHKWDRVFYLAAGVVAFGTTSFLLFGSSERQDFDRIEIRLPVRKTRSRS